MFLSGLILAQQSQVDFEKELKQQNSAIQSLRNEIEATKKRIQSENQKEKSSSKQVINLSEEISLLQRLVKEIDKEEKLLVADSSSKLSSTRAKWKLPSETSSRLYSVMVLSFRTHTPLSEAVLRSPAGP